MCSFVGVMRYNVLHITLILVLLETFIHFLNSYVEGNKVTGGARRNTKSVLAVSESRFEGSVV